MRDAAGRTIQYRYDAAGQLVRLQDGAGDFVDYEYFDDGSLSRVDYLSINRPTPDVSYSYYPRGQRQTMVDGTGTTTYGYDSLDRLKSVEHSNGSRVDYAYDEAGNITGITYPANRDTVRRTVTRSFDAAGRMKTVRDFSGNETTFNYDRNGNLREILYPGGPSSTLVHDAANRVTGMTHTLQGAPYYRLDYARDEIGLLSSAVEMQSGQPDVTHYYGYDELNRLRSDNRVSAGSTLLSLFELDAGGQITQTTSYPTPGQRTYTDRVYDGVSQLAMLAERNDGGPLGSFSFGYSATGNRLTQTESGSNAPVYSYQYDQANRLTSFTKHSSNEVSSYSYNGDGLRLTKPYPGNLTLEMTWDVAAGLPLLLYDGNAAYIYGPGGMLLAQAVEGINGPGAPAERSEAALTPEPLTHRYYLADQLGNVIALIDPTQGSLLDSYSYDAYGRRSCSPCGWYNPFGYAGQYGDEESGLVYMRARYYDPATQQFISRDPLGGSQPYVYAGGSPVNATDPTGAFADWPLDAVFIAMDVADIAANGLSWENGTSLALDLLLAPVPFVPAGVGLARRIGSGARLGGHADDLISGGVGLGKVANREINVTERGISMIERHLTRAELTDAGLSALDFPYNPAMIARLRAALHEGRTISGADASFYLHELAEFTLMNKGLSYDRAHRQALAKYGVSKYSVYHPDVIRANAEWFSPEWFNFWGIQR